MPNCSHSSLTVNRALCANMTNRMISSIGVTLLQDIMLGSVTHHPGLSVTYHSGSYRTTFIYLTRALMGDPFHGSFSKCPSLWIEVVGQRRQIICPTSIFLCIVVADSIS